VDQVGQAGATSDQPGSAVLEKPGELLGPDGRPVLAEAQFLCLPGQVGQRGDARVGCGQLPQDPYGIGSPAPGEYGGDAVPPVPCLLVPPDSPGGPGLAACLVGPVPCQEFPEFAELVRGEMVRQRAWVTGQVAQDLAEEAGRSVELAG